MTARTILIHRGGWGPNHRLGSINVRPDGEHCGYSRYTVVLNVRGDSRHAEASVIEERLADTIAEYTATASLKETYVEAGARRRREAERQEKKRRARRR